MLSPFLGALEVQVCHLSATRVRHRGRSFDASAGAVRRRHRVVPSGGLHCDALRHAFKLDLPCSYPLPRFDFTIFVTEEETETVTESPSQVGTCVIRCDTKKDRCTLVGPRADSRPTFAVHIAGPGTEGGHHGVSRSAPVGGYCARRGARVRRRFHDAGGPERAGQPGAGDVAIHPGSDRPAACRLHRLAARAGRCRPPGRPGTAGSARRSTRGSS